MFQFKSIELMNWDFWPHFELPFDERIIMLAGPNGSGKTTFLDSLRLLLGAKSLSTGRKMSKYLRSGDKVAMIKGVVTNQLRHGKRPFRQLAGHSIVIAFLYKRSAHVTCPGEMLSFLYTGEPRSLSDLAPTNS